ncbi:hypothetical protein EJ08DRAFT_74790 [Tothia fuscella]|uniref:Small ribosomal subunit protein mS41 n=1 Tax=Tothia fuscella TaxID=1048955 RepID=A0A9P4NXT4_9PEZI|nr:hypothetical protein EJ08DRAFT_74790 [Tothia fuscella]
MILRRPILSLKPTTSSSTQCRRLLHNRLSTRPIPPPTPFVPDVETFLKLIGRQLSSHKAKIPSWSALFTLSSVELRNLGIEPARSRKYLLRWRERFRQGKFGIGGDMTEVTDGIAEMKMYEVPVPEEWLKSNPSLAEGTATRSPGMRRVAINVPLGLDEPIGPLDEAKPVEGVKVKDSKTIVGPHVFMVKGTGGLKARIAVKEGLWEDRRGHKVDGGERRKAEVRSKKRAEERKKARS